LGFNNLVKPSVPAGLGFALTTPWIGTQSGFRFFLKSDIMPGLSSSKNKMKLIIINQILQEDL
jgi:hypothetical protein